MGDIHTGERETLGLLRRKLPSDFYVFHSVHWSVQHRKFDHLMLGEIDFVVVNRCGQVLVIEQKNGALNERDGKLYKTYRIQHKDPHQQILRSMNQVRDKFRTGRRGCGKPLTIYYLLYLPDYTVKNLNAVGLDQSRVVDYSRAAELPDVIESLLRSEDDHDPAHHESVMEFFSDQFEVIPVISEHEQHIEQDYERNVGPVTTILTHLQMKPFRLRFRGVAGSGKSRVAQQFFRSQSEAGKRVLMSCFNRPLAESLAPTMRDTDGRVHTFHGLCTKFLKSIGEPVAGDGDTVDENYFRDLPNRVLAAEVGEEWKFDALVVDEGQDFDEYWIEVLKLFLRDPGSADILWLEDPDQNLQNKPAIADPGFVGYHCLDNYRNPALIARFIQRVLPFEFDNGNALPGLGVGVHPYTESDKQGKLVDRVVQQLLRQGFALDEIVILSYSGTNSSFFSEQDKIGNHRLRRFTGQFDERGRQVLSEGQLVFDTVRRFKGQSSPAVILVDVDPHERELAIKDRLLYCGMTRATIRLDVVCQGDNPYNRKLLQES